MQLVEVKPIQPFVGSYPCALADADSIDDVLVEDEASGLLNKRRQARKRFSGKIAVQRYASPVELERIRSGDLPPNICVIGDAKAAQVFVEVSPEQPTVKVPSGIADDLVARGLAERVAA